MCTAAGRVGEARGGQSLAECRWLSGSPLPNGATCVFRMTLKHVAAERRTGMDLDPMALSLPWWMGLGMVSTFITFSQKL